MGLTVDIKRQLKNFKMDVSFEASKGCMGILGASGCGKSMTLKAIAGIVTPDSGKIIHEGVPFFDGEKRINQSPQKRRVGFLFQNYALFPNMTVEENIYAGLLKKTKENDHKVADMIERFQLADLEKHYPKMLSGGQQQRVALARILVCSPQILLLDEPFSALDAYLKEELQLELREILRGFDGISIMVTHDRDEAYKLCDTMMVMEHGSVISKGAVKEMFASPNNYQTARLTGCKNIAKAEKIGSHKVRVIDWQVDLSVSEEVPEDIQYIGIRAHDFFPVLEKPEEEQNLFELIAPEPVYGPFEESIIFKAANGARIWWKLEGNLKGNLGQLPPYVSVEPKDIMLLK